MKNALSIVKGDVVRHKVRVTLPGDSKPKTLYLLMISGETSTLEDLKSTFGDKISTLHLRLAKKVWGEGRTQNTYGVFVDDDLKMVFAFNRLFADFENGQVVYRDLDEIIEKAVDGNQESALGEDFQPEPLFPFDDFENTPSRPGGGMMIRYSIPDPSED